MTKSEIFKAAHKAAKSGYKITKSFQSDLTYSKFFGRMLRAEYKKLREAKEVAKIPAKVIYLDVPYCDKDKAKKSGAKWDAQARSWYVYAPVVPFALKQWERKDQYSARLLSTTDYAA